MPEQHDFPSWDKQTSSVAEGGAAGVGHLDFMSKAMLRLPQHPSNEDAWKTG